MALFDSVSLERGRAFTPLFLAGLAGLLMLLALPGRGAGAPAPNEISLNEISLPLADYLALVDKAEKREKAAAASAKIREAPVAEVVEEHLAIRLGDREALLDSTFEVLVQGEPIQAVWLPLAGYGTSATIEKQGPGGGWAPAGAASLAAFGSSDKGAHLVTPERGRYRVKAQSRLPLEGGGQLELRLLKVAAPVASAEIDLPAELEWSSPGAVVVADNVTGGRRQLRLATQRGSVPVLQAKRRFEQGEEKPLAHAVALTLIQLRPEGLRRHDVLLYEVSRGRLSSFAVRLPPGLEVEQAATDEGLVVPVTDGDRLRVERRRQLTGTGYLVLSSTPAATGELAFTKVEPENMEVRARYLAVASSLAAEIAPLPAASFSQIDLSDLPPLLGQALGAVDLAAAWRLADDKGPLAPLLALRIAPLPPADAIATTVLKRETTTLLTVDGTLLHREIFSLAPTGRPASSFEVALPAGAILWSTKVDGQPTRPLQRAGKIVLPILPKPGEVVSIEVVAVLEQAIPAGRSQLAVELAQVTAPVLEHDWQVLLPDGPKYRFAAGELHPVPADFQFEPMVGRISHGVGGSVEGGVPGGVPGGTFSTDSAAAAADHGAISGRVTADGTALPGALVTVAGPSGTAVMVTDAGGRFNFDPLPPGQYRVVAELEGFSTTETQIQLGGRRVSLGFELQPAGVEEMITISSESALLDERKTGRGRDRPEPGRKAEADEDREGKRATANYSQQVDQLQQGLVGGVKPLPITIPETGKSLLLTGVLPPERVSVTIDVKAKK